MRTKLFSVVFFMLASLSLHSQTIYESIQSQRLGEERQLKIQLPRNYDTNTSKLYPIVVVLDGDYMFEPMAGNIDLYSYWEEIPEAIVVGVNQVKNREMDCLVDDQRYLPAGPGANFYEFLGMELLPYLSQKYRTTDFKVIAGHGSTANFINYFLFKEQSLFDAYISLSPDLGPEMANRLEDALTRTKQKTWYYLATSTQDMEEWRLANLELDGRLKLVGNSNLHYSFDNFDEASHFSLIGRALPRALERIFINYKPISLHEYENEILISESSPYEYLLKKYKQIREQYHVAAPIKTNDFLAIGRALEEKQQWKELQKLGELALKTYPNSLLGTYYEARAYEEDGRPRKAMKAYQNAYGQEEIAFITVDFMLRKAEDIKEDFGY